jgi:hypothetical protein
VPALHKRYIASMVDMFGACTEHCVHNLERASGHFAQSVDMENFYSRLGLDIIGKAVFNYDFDSLSKDDAIIQVRCCVRSMHRVCACARRCMRTCIVPVCRGRWVWTLRCSQSKQQVRCNGFEISGCHTSHRFAWFRKRLADLCAGSVHNAERSRAPQPLSYPILEAAICHRHHSSAGVCSLTCIMPASAVMHSTHVMIGLRGALG